MTLDNWHSRLEQAKITKEFTTQDREAIKKWQTCIVGERDSQLYSTLSTSRPTVKEISEHIISLGRNAIHTVFDDDLAETEKIILEVESTREINFYKRGIAQK